MMSDLYWLTDEQMARLQPYFPKSHGRERVDDRRVLSGIIFVNRNGLRARLIIRVLRYGVSCA
jgi:transposase